MKSYIREYELTFVAADGTTKTFTQTNGKTGLMIDFDINKSKSDGKNEAIIGITNPSRDTIAALQKEGVITFKAGYKDDIATIMIGEIESFVYEDDGANKRIELRILEGNTSYKNLLINRYYNIGATSIDIVADLVSHIITYVPSVESANAYQLLDFNSYQFPQVIYGNAYDKLGQILYPLGYEYFVNKGVLTIIKQNGFIRELEVTLNADNGMIGSPKPISETNDKKETVAGVEAKSILNYNMDIGRRLKIESQEINSTFRIDAVNFSGNSFEGEWIVNIKAYEIN